MFRKLMLAIAAVALSAATVQASDIYTPDNAYQDTGTTHAFAGLSVGIHGGGQFVAIELDHDGNDFDGISSDGLVGGAHAEYLFSAGRFRVGPYVEGGFSDVSTRINGGPFNDADVLAQDHYYSGGVKIGLMVSSQTMAYGRAGYEWSQWSSDLFDGNADVEAYLLGGGIETMVAEQVSLGVGVDYLTLSSAEYDGTDITAFVDDTESVRALLRLNWRP